LNGWLGHTGDYQGLHLLRLYQVYRAMVRAKVAALRASQPGHDATSLATVWAEYRGYITLAERLSRPMPLALFLTHGFSGSGKTTLTQPMVEHFGTIRLRSDVERKRLFGLKSLEKSASGLEGGIYTADASTRTYGRLAELAALVIEAGYPVIVDATFLRRTQRDTFRELTVRLNVPFFILDFQAPPETLRQRIGHRAMADNDASEADLAVLEKQFTTQEPLAESEQPHVIVVDSEAPDAAEELCAVLAGKGMLGQ